MKLYLTSRFFEAPFPLLSDDGPAVGSSSIAATPAAKLGFAGFGRGRGDFFDADDGTEDDLSGTV